MKQRIISALIVAACTVGITGFAWKEYNRYEPLQDKVVVELGEKLDEDASLYLKANKTALEETEMDFSGVDFLKAGEYEATAKYGEKTANIAVVVEDTVAPEVTLSGNEYKGVAGQEIKATELISKVDDKAGIESVEFAENQIETEAQGEDLLDAISLKYDTAGQYTAVVTVTDKSGNTTKKEIAMKIVEDYLAHVSGMQDLTVEQGSSIDWLAGITKDEKILEIKADASKVDINTAGEYTLTYIIAGDDQETTVQKDVKVTVVTPQKAQSLANSGSTVKTTGGTKKKAASSSGSSSGKKSSGSSSKSSGGSKNSGSSGNKSSGGSWLDSLTPGQSWEGTITGSGTIDNYNGNTYEEGTW